MMDEREDVWPWQGGHGRPRPMLTWHEGTLWGQYPPPPEPEGRERLAHLYRARARRALLVAVSLSVMAAATVAFAGLVGSGWSGALGAVLVAMLVTLASYALGRSSELSQRADQTGA